MARQRDRSQRACEDKSISCCLNDPASGWFEYGNANNVIEPSRNTALNFARSVGSLRARWDSFTVAIGERTVVMLNRSTQKH